MTMMMSLVSLVLHAFHVDISMISLAIIIHVLGMFALSVPLRWLTDRIGRRGSWSSAAPYQA